MTISGSIHRIRETLARADAENSPQTTQGSVKEKATASLRNAAEATLETLNALPGTHMVSAPVSVIYGLGKIAYGAARFFMAFGSALAGGGSDSKSSDAATSYVKSGFKTAALGGLAMIPVVGWIPNAVAAGLDVIDAANSALPPSQKKAE
ncbi:MAG: hypothetical protein HY791_23240 [Deltaproteobacteria bacterium]|nr:hypothetical protein [Deltaproteobacteria bacterium]